MKISKKTALVFTLVCLFLIGLAVPSYSWTRKNVQKIENSIIQNYRQLS